MPSFEHVHDLVLVAGHATFKSEVRSVPAQPELDDWWILDERFQLGEPPFYIEHIRRGVVLAAHNPAAMLVFSGGLTRAGTHWSEARAYHDLAIHHGLWIPDAYNADGRRERILARTEREEYARDSYENLLYGVCRFHQLTGRYPRLVTVVSWAFKAARFDLHRDAIGFPRERFRFDPCNDPIDRDGAWRGEKAALGNYIQFPHGTGGTPLKTRIARTHGSRAHGYGPCDSLRGFIAILESNEPSSPVFPQDIAW